jgi:cell division transport system permease protein
MSPIARHILRRAFRSLWENLYLNLVATTVIATAVFLLGIFLSVALNVGGVVEGWQRDTHVSAYLVPGTPEARRQELLSQISAMPEVSSVRLLSEEEATAWMKEQVPEARAVLEDLGVRSLPASLEITLRPERAGPEDVRAIVARLETPEIEELDHGTLWVERLRGFLSILRAIGLLLGSIIVFAAAFLIYNTIHLVVYNRRQELETMWLVGATPSFITVPFLVEGFFQGLFGAVVGVLGVLGLERLLSSRLDAAFAIGGETLRALPHHRLLLLVFLGVVLAMLGGGVAVLRFLRRAP